MSDEPSIGEVMREAARINGNDPDVAMDELQKLDMCFEMAQNMQLAFLERCNDIGVNPLHGLLSMYNLTRFQINANLKRGNITRKDVRAMRFAADLCRALRHPDGEYPMMIMDTDGNFVRAETTHTETQTTRRDRNEL